jgi:hypothetical protein
MPVLGQFLTEANEEEKNRKHLAIDLPELALHYACIDNHFLMMREIHSFAL